MSNYKINMMYSECINFALHLNTLASCFQGNYIKILCWLHVYDRMKHRIFLLFQILMASAQSIGVFIFRLDLQFKASLKLSCVCGVSLVKEKFHKRPF